MSELTNRISITGGSGFVGVNLISALSKNKQYHINSIDLRAPNINISDIGDVIIHLAGKAHDLKNTSDPSEYFSVNTDLTKKLFEAFLQSQAHTFIFMSSVKAVADSVEGTLTESITANPQTSYGKSKQLAEQYILNAILPERKRIFILRPCMIHGPGNKGNLNLLFKFAQKGLPYPLGAFENKRSFLSIENLNYIIERLLADPNIEGGIYNLADTEPLSTSEVMKIISSVLGNDSRIWRLSPWFVRFIAALGDKTKLPFNSEKLQKLTESYVVSNKKIKHALGLAELPIISVDGLTHTIKSFRASIEK